jgi:predicted hydrolase (HD superfamily)
MVWKATPPGRERDLVNGMILVAAALVHDQKDEQDICMSILKRAAKKLDGATGSYHGIDVDRFTKMVHRMLDAGRAERFTI